MKIAFFVHGYLPWDAYGVPRYVERLGDYLANRGHQVYIVVVGRPSLRKIEHAKSDLTVYRTSYIDLPSKGLRPFWSFALYTIGSLVEASRLVNKEGIQILHGHTVQWGGLQSALVSRITHKPCIITLHGSGIDGHSEGKMPRHLKFLRRADIITCRKMSAVTKLVSWNFPKKKLLLLPQGCVDTDRFRPAKIKLPKPQSVVTFVGRLVTFKGPQLLLEAAPHVLSKYPNTLFQFIGEGNLREHLWARAESLCIADHVKFLGFRSDVDEILRSSDVFVSLSPYENVADLSLLEAMSTGIPVVATDVGETRSTVRNKETGLLAKCDPKDVAEKIIKVFDDKQLANNLSKNERELVVKDHCLERLGQRQEEIYWSMISNDKP